ncbi:MAG: helix-turn-helix transcriptional regulator [Clostridia bacterium]|nr:helix-turn-helix transcriptional regulator [Clostridia bacterium]
MSLGGNIYKLRALKGWSQTELAEVLEVSRQSVSKWENNTAIPDLDKLIKMRLLFDVTLDELVFEDCPKAPAETPASPLRSAIPFRPLAGIVLLVFGMIFFLMSIFFGDHLYFGEAFGELLSAVIVLVSVALIAPYDFRAFTVCTVIYFVYSLLCHGILHANDIINSVFIFIASIVILVWFIVCGQHAAQKPSGS